MRSEELAGGCTIFLNMYVCILGMAIEINIIFSPSMLVLLR